MILFRDSFGHYVTADFLLKWTSVNSGGGQGISAGAGRNGANALVLGNNAAYYVRKSGLGNKATMIGHLAWNSNGAWVAGTVILSFSDAGTTQCDLRTAASGELSVTRNGTVLATSSGLGLVAGSWYQFQLKTLINAAGSFEVKLNNVSIAALTASGVNTQAVAGHAYANEFSLWGAVGNPKVCDLCICDDSGSYNNDFLGDVRVIYTAPNADGSDSAWTASAGTDISCVDETAPNGDTDYIKSLTPGQISAFTFPALGITGDVLDVAVHLEARKDDAGSRSICGHLKSGGTAFAGDTKSIGDTYLYYTDHWESDPGSSPVGPWSVAGVDAAELGVKLVS